MTRQNRGTKQKLILEKTLDTFDSFFSGEELFEKVKDKGISLATVYRFLKDARDNHLLHSFLCDRKMIYTKNSHHHCHFICEKCGTRTHITINSLDFLKKNVPGSICHFQIDITGICLKCQK